MQKWSYLTWLAKQAADGLRWAWPVTVVLTFLLLAAAVWSRRRISALFRAPALWQLVPLGVAPALLALGTWFACQNCSPSSLGQGHRYMWAMRACDALLVAQLVGAALLVKAASPLRLLAASFQLLLLWCSYWAAFMAGMSMSGDWL